MKKTFILSALLVSISAIGINTNALAEGVVTQTVDGVEQGTVNAVQGVGEAAGAVVTGTAQAAGQVVDGVAKGTEKVVDGTKDAITGK